MAATNDTTPPSVNDVTEAEERDGFVEYCKLRTCERMEVDRVDELEELDDQGLNQLRLIAIESKLEWRQFTYAMKMVYIFYSLVVLDRTWFRQVNIEV
ncbi:hypothetical protein BGX34_007621 [Mortierella sp. NVP85]|nr:hypothetical protein BGX34_007621 [Mortierella sp. NVP85]